jgi:5'-AMP-activated protein kinase, catalytic alpha subunit
MSENRRESRRDTRNIGSYILGATLGEGAFGKVRVATHIHTGEKVAIKILDKNAMQEDPDDIVRVQTEIAILKKMRHKNIIQLYEIMESTKNIYLVMEYCEGKELFEYIVMKKKLSEDEALKFFQEIIDAVDYLHSQNIVHRDLKPENLLLDFKYSIKVSDFGLSRLYENDRLLSTPCGTPSYAPPEMLKGEEYHGLLSDVWSSGVILYAMLCGYLPFSESNEEINCQKIIQGEFEIPDWISEEAADLLKNILQIDPLDRYDLEQIKAHPWFNANSPPLRPGLIVGFHKIPVDENILRLVENYGYNGEKAKNSLVNNKFDVMTAIYYLSLRKFIKEGGISLSDLQSEYFLQYINNPNNLVNPPDVSQEKSQNHEEYLIYANNYNSFGKANEDVLEDFPNQEQNLNPDSSNLNINLSLNKNQISETDKINETSENILNEANLNITSEDHPNLNEFEHTKANANDSHMLIQENSEIKIESSNSDKNMKSRQLSIGDVKYDDSQSHNKDILYNSAHLEENPDVDMTGNDSSVTPTNEQRISVASKRISIRMANKHSIFIHDRQELFSNLEIFESKKNILNTNESMDNSQSLSQLNLFQSPTKNILNVFKRNSISFTNSYLEIEKERFLKYNNNPRKSLNIEGNNDFRNSILRALQTMTPGRLDMDYISDSSKSDINQSLRTESSKSKLNKENREMSTNLEKLKSPSGPISHSIKGNKNSVNSKLDQIQNKKQKNIAKKDITKGKDKSNKSPSPIVSITRPKSKTIEEKNKTNILVKKDTTSNSRSPTPVPSKKTYENRNRSNNKSINLKEKSKITNKSPLNNTSSNYFNKITNKKKDINRPGTSLGGNYKSPEIIITKISSQNNSHNYLPDIPHSKDRNNSNNKINNKNIILSKSLNFQSDINNDNSSITTPPVSKRERSSSINTVATKISRNKNTQSFASVTLSSKNEKKEKIQQKLKNKKFVQTSYNTNFKTQPYQYQTFRENKFETNNFKTHVNKFYVDSSIEKSTSKTPIRNLSFSPDTAIKPQNKRIEVIPWNLKKRIIETSMVSKKNKIISEYEEFKKEKLDRKLKYHRIKVSKLEKSHERKIESTPQKKLLDEKNTQVKIVNTRLNLNKNKIMKDNRMFSPFRLKNVMEHSTQSNNASLSNFNYNTTNSQNLNSSRKPANKKVFVIQDINLEHLKTYSGPVDLSCIINLDITKIVEKTIEILNKKKIVYVQTNPYKFRCSKNGLSYDIEIFKLEEMYEFYYLKFKISQGDDNYFRSLSSSILCEFTF